MAKDFQTIDDVRQQLENQTCGVTQTFVSTLSTASITASPSVITATSSQPIGEIATDIF